MSRLYAIGDVHGHHDALVDLLGRMERDGMDPERDTVIFLGDYIDRGLAAYAVVETVRWLIEKYPHWWALRGNHEQMMLDALERGPEDWATFMTWWTQGGRETASSFTGVPLIDVEPIHTQTEAFHRESLDWMHTLPHLLVRDDYAFVHAGVEPKEDWQFGTDPHDLTWIREPFLSSGFDYGRIIVHGHTPVKAPEVRANRIGIDTMLRGGYLTAVELSGEAPRFVYSNGEGAT